MTKSQDGETRLCLVDDRIVIKITSPLTSKDKGTSSSLKLDKVLSWLLVGGYREVNVLPMKVIALFRLAIGSSEGRNEGTPPMREDSEIVPSSDALHLHELDVAVSTEMSCGKPCRTMFVAFMLQASRIFSVSVSSSYLLSFTVVGVVSVPGHTPGYNFDVIKVMSVEELLDLIMDLGGSNHMTYKIYYLFYFKEYDGGNVLLGDGRECRIRGTGEVRVQMRDGSSFVLDNGRKDQGYKGFVGGTIGNKKGQVVTRNTLKGRKQLGEYHIVWKIKMGNVLDSCNQGSTQQYMNDCQLWRFNDVTSKAVLYRDMVFSETEEHKKTFIGFGVASEREQHLARELFRCKEDIKDAPFAISEVKKIYVHELLTFDDTFSFEDEIWVTKGLLDKAHGNVLGMEIARDVSEKNGKWSYAYAVESQEYQVVCMRPDIASTGVDTLDGFDHGLLTNVKVFVDFDYAMERSITVMGRLITRYGLMIHECVRRFEAILLHMVALLSIEVEYIKLTEAVKEAIWLSHELS
ncbi:hypothetical protein Tco_0486459 [Tanacetum coccineum]